VVVVTVVAVVVGAVAAVVVGRVARAHPPMIKLAASSRAGRGLADSLIRDILEAPSLPEAW
jgi:hypothetical protein